MRLQAWLEMALENVCWNNLEWRCILKNESSYSMHVQKAISISYTHCDFILLPETSDNLNYFNKLKFLGKFTNLQGGHKVFE